MTFAEQLRKVRTRAGLTRAEAEKLLFGKIIPFQYGDLYKWENNVGEPHGQPMVLAILEQAGKWRDPKRK